MTPGETIAIMSAVIFSHGDVTKEVAVNHARELYDEVYSRIADGEIADGGRPGLPPYAPGFPVPARRPWEAYR